MRAEGEPGGGEEKPLAAPPYPAAVSHPKSPLRIQRSPYASLRPRRPLRAPTPLALSRTHTRTRTRPRSHACHPHAPETTTTKWGPPTPYPGVFPRARFAFNVLGGFFSLRGRGGEGGYNGGDTMRGKQYGKNKYFWSVNLTFVPP